MSAPPVFPGATEAELRAFFAHLPRGVYCVEFSTRWRQVDVTDGLAFLVPDTTGRVVLDATHEGADA